MSDCSDNKNPLQHNGSSQVQRLLPGMDKNQYARVDEKDFDDWIVFAGEFAEYIKYYNTDNEFSRNWQVFFNSDISARLARVAIQDIRRYRIEIKERFDFIRDDDNKSSPGAVRLKLNELFSALLTLSKALDESWLKLPDETTLKSTIENLIRGKLAPALKRLISYHAAAENLGYLNHSLLSPWKILNKPITDAAQIISTEGLDMIWLYETSEASWNDYVISIAEDNSVFNNPLTGFSNDYLSMEHAANHNLFSGIFDTFLTAYTKIIKDAEAGLLKTLESYDSHPAHYALFLSFLKLFRFAQTHINTITGRHLDFYYREVLRLQPRAAEANQVHIIGELAKQVDNFLLAAGTALKAGKDSLNNDVAYTLDADTVLSKAGVVQLKAFYKGNDKDTVYFPGTNNVKQNNTGRGFASPVANSGDGLGAELTTTSKEWHPFVSKVYSEGALESISMPKAQLGLALASHYLFLTEGERKVSIRFATSPSSILDGKNIECWLTTEKEWYRVESPAISSTGKKLSDLVTGCTEISFTIPGSAPAITDYNAAVHGGTFNMALPVLKIYLVNQDDKAYEYDLLKDTTITRVEIKVEVGMDSGYNQKGLKNLLFSNDTGTLDASKPFLPFGSQPTAGNRLVIGSREIFTKKNASVVLNIEWKDLPDKRSNISYAQLSDSGDYPNIAVNNLEGGIWKTLKSYDELFDSQGSEGVKSTRQISLPLKSLDKSIAAYADEYALYDIKSSRGFAALQLLQSFGHKEYLKDLSKFLVEKSPDIPDTVSEPAEPYTPVIQSFHAGYSAYCIAEPANAQQFGSREIFFFHIHPFGEGEQHKALQPGDDVYLLPQFKHTEEGIPQQHAGEFYTGLENAAPGEAVNILFQVLEGTTDPTLAKPEGHVHWSYLGNNRWIDFESGEYSDNTLDLVQSGIISFAIPKEASTENTILPAGYIWLRASVKESAEAVCKLLSVDAHAAVATFSDSNNAEDFLDKPLAAGTISKLKSPDAAIKKISQPYPSFGGRQKESDDHFYIRVSERLRHKARAITIWDYEHIVLEAFPEIYKVKCLNHTQIEDGIYNEVRPGYVSLITIPSLQNRNDANPLKPYTQQSTLTKIENYLKKRVSCFVNLHAAQPQFEEVRLEFSLKLYEEYRDFTFYSNMLKEEITEFLSPWAFGSPSSLDFGGKIYKSVMINFIEERYYVDFITDVFMYVKVNEVSNESGDLDEITASTARSILVSAPASRMVIHEIDDEADSAAEPCPDL